MLRTLGLSLLVACSGAAQPAPPPRYVPEEPPREDSAPVVDTRASAADPIVARIDAAIAAMSTMPGTPCIRDAQGQLATARRSAEDRRRSVLVAMDRGDHELMDHELAILGVLASRASQLLAGCP